MKDKTASNNRNKHNIADGQTNDSISSENTLDLKNKLKKLNENILQHLQNLTQSQNTDI